MSSKIVLTGRVKGRRFARGLFWGCALVTASFALYPNLSLPEPRVIGGYTQYVNHFIAFAVLAFFGIWGWGMRWRLVILLGIAVLAIELAQTLSPGRQASLLDLPAGFFGVGAGLFLARLISLLAQRCFQA